MCVLCAQMSKTHCCLGMSRRTMTVASVTIIWSMVGDYQGFHFKGQVSLALSSLVMSWWQNLWRPTTVVTLKKKAKSFLYGFGNGRKLLCSRLSCPCLCLYRCDHDWSQYFYRQYSIASLLSPLLKCSLVLQLNGQWSDCTGWWQVVPLFI